MDFIKINSDYDWVVKVLQSCKRLEQLTVAENLFKNFINKWIDELSEERTLKLNWNFQKHKSQKIIELKK